MDAFSPVNPVGGDIVFYVDVMVMLFHPFRVVYFVYPWFYNYFSPSGLFTAERICFIACECPQVCAYRERCFSKS
ncbi:MAG: hypothetical protein CV087_15815 [Candidatus Brocadia sp. WS118]|nr:MAG: hypothetical protein CV087_15815 [Candidatus Brocadia sp. WS118]